MSTPRIAIVSFPGNNCEVESIRAINNAGMEAVPVLWNGDKDLLRECDGYFLPGGFSYEDRGRAGMVAARDPVLAVIAEEAAKGKPVIGICNGAQVLVETGLIPLNANLKMSLARNVSEGSATGFLGEWVWITPSCSQDRCCTSNWSGAMHIPIAHGEGRFTTKDPDVLTELKENNQIAFSYCDEQENVSEDPIVTPNGSVHAIAGICNPEGTIVALMPHPERSPSTGAPYFASLKTWIENNQPSPIDTSLASASPIQVPSRAPQGTEIFIDTIITNNEERTVEQAAKRIVPSITLKQLKYFSLSSDTADSILETISLFNPNKEIAYLRRGNTITKWNADTKSEESVDSPLNGIALLRRDEPDTGSVGLESGSQTGVCYVCCGLAESDVENTDLLEIFGNPHASTIEQLV